MRHVLVLSCIDPRFTERLAEYLRNDRGLDEYDLIVLAGASLGAEQKAWQRMFFDHVDLAVKLHHAKELWVFDHADCGMYKKVFGKDERAQHYRELEQVKSLMAKKYPALAYVGYIMDLNGRIQRVE
jgi:carbonic anhydrase